MSQFSKLSNDVLIKKITALSKDLDDFIPPDFSSFSREDIESLCTEITSKVKILKDSAKKLQEEEAQKRKLEEEEEIKKRKLEKEAKEKEILDNSICDPNLLNRLKNRFFNLAVPDEDDPDGLNPNTSPPFFDNIKDQFHNELSNREFKFYKAVYNAEDMSDQEEYKIRNRNKTLASIVQEDYSMYFFVCFRILKENDEIKYVSYWISNFKNNLSEKFDSFEFEELELNNFIDFFMKNEDCMDEIYVR